jgi:hypothetical protein
VLTMHLKNTAPARHLDQHLVFDKSIFRDVVVSTEGNDTTVTVNTTAVSRFAIVPLEEPARLLVTFAPPESETSQAASEMGPMPSGSSRDVPPPSAEMDSAPPDAGSEPPSGPAPDMPPGSTSGGSPDVPAGAPLGGPGPY